MSVEPTPAVSATAGTAPPSAGVTTPTPAPVVTDTTSLLSPAPTKDAGKTAATEAPAEQGKKEATPGEAPKADAPKGDVPADFEIQLPKGVEADAVSLTELKALAKEHGVKGEVAQKFVDLHLKTQALALEKHRASWETQQKSWQEQARTDKEYGGTKFTENIKAASSALKKYGGQELADLIDARGLGNHPGMIRLAYQLARATGEDKVAGGGAGPSAPKSLEAQLNALYPNSPELK